MKKIPLSYSRDGIMQDSPWVTLGMDVAMQVVFCIIPGLANTYTCMYNYFGEEICKTVHWVNT